MGLLGTLFGAGTDISLTLGVRGEVVSGTVTLVGGPKPLNLTAVAIAATLDHRELANTTLAANYVLEAEHTAMFDFSLTLPEDADPESVVVNATATFENGWWNQRSQLVRNPDDDTRSQILHDIAGSDQSEKLRVRGLYGFASDASEDVRRDVAALLGGFGENPDAMRVAAEIAKTDPAPRVRAAALKSLASARPFDGVIDVYTSLLASPEPAVRAAIASRLSLLQSDPRVEAITRTLLEDEDASVRRAIVDQAMYMFEFPLLSPKLKELAERDPDLEVRATAVETVARAYMAPADSVAYVGARLAADPSERLAQAASTIARTFDDEALGDKLRAIVAGSPFASAALSSPRPF